MHEAGFEMSNDPNAPYNGNIYAKVIPHPVLQVDPYLEGRDLNDVYSMTYEHLGVDKYGNTSSDPKLPINWNKFKKNIDDPQYDEKSNLVNNDSDPEIEEVD
jgi:hypothetical protein